MLFESESLVEAMNPLIANQQTKEFSFKNIKYLELCVTCLIEPSFCVPDTEFYVCGRSSTYNMCSVVGMCSDGPAKEGTPCKRDFSCGSSKKISRLKFKKVCAECSVVMVYDYCICIPSKEAHVQEGAIRMYYVFLV